MSALLILISNELHITYRFMNKIVDNLRYDGFLSPK